MKSYEKILNEVQSIKNWIEDHRHGNYIALNVKIYSNVATVYDLEYIMTEQNYTDEQKEYLRDIADNNWFCQHWDWFLEDQARYFIEDYIHGCTISSNEYYEGLKAEIKKGKKTCYPYIEKKRSIQSKLKEVEKWQKRDNQQSFYLSMLSTREIGFFGRSGGWLSITDFNSFFSLLEDIELNVQYKEKSDALYTLKEAKNLLNAVVWLYNAAKKMHEGIPESWKEEVKFRLNEELENFCGEDCQIESKLQAITD